MRVACVADFRQHSVLASATEMLLLSCRKVNENVSYAVKKQKNTIDVYLKKASGGTQEETFSVHTGHQFRERRG